MVSKNNQWQHLRASAQRVPHYGLRKLSVGVASVLLSTTLYMGVSAHADTVVTPGETTTPATTTVTTPSPSADKATSETAGSGANVTSTDPASETPTSQATPGSAGTTSEKPTDSTAGAKGVSETADSKVGSGTPVNDGQPANPQSTVNRLANTTGTTTTVASDATLKTTDNATITWTIHYVDETGNHLQPDSVISHDYTRTDIGDQMGNWSYVPDSVKVTGTPNNGWHIDNPDFKFDQIDGKTTFDFATWYATAASIDGYTPNYSSVVLTDELPKNPESLHGTTAVDSGTHEFTFVYTKQPTKVTINYVDDEQGEKVVGTGTVSGKSGTEVTITPQLPKDYMLTPNKDVPSTYTVTDADNQVVTIHVQKQFVDTSDTDPQAKQTRTITLHYVYGAGDKQGQPAFDDAVLNVYYHRTATLDRATNQTTYGDWTWDNSQGDTSTPGYHVVSGKWTNLPQSWATVQADVPSIKGYYADLGQNDSTNTNHVPSNTWVFPTYNNSLGGGISEGGKGATAYLDGYGYEVNPTHTIKYMPNKTTVTVNYVDDDNNGVNVGSQHWDGTTGQHIDLTLTPPDNYVLTPGWVNPSSYDFDGVNSAWYTVHVKHKTQDVTDQEPKDQVNKTETLTRKHLYGPGPHEGEKFGEPDIIEVPWHRTATKDLVTGKVSFGDWHVIWDEVKQLSGATKMWGDSEHNYVNGGLIAWHSGYSYIGVGAKTEAITTDGTVSGHAFYWMSEQDIENHPTIVQYYGREKVGVPVNYVDFDTNQQLTTRRLTGDNYLDGNTIPLNKDDLTDWGKAVSNNYQLYAKQTLPTTYKIDTVSNDGNLTPITVYVVQPRTVQFTFADNDSTVNGQHPQVGDAALITGITGSTTPVSLTVPVGYKLVEGQQLPTTHTFVKGEQNQVILLTHQHVTVQPDAPKTPSDKLPDNPSKSYPSGVAKDDLTKTVTRKVTITTPDNKSTVTNQTVTFTRNATVDEVTGNVTYGSWSENGKHEFVTVNVPIVAGYTANGDVPSLTVTPNSKDTTVTINYTANEQSTQIVFVDKDGKTIDTVNVNGKTGETVDTNAKVPDKWKLVDNETVPSTITFSADTPDKITVHVEHKIVTKQLKINVYFVLKHLIKYTYNINQGGLTYLPWISDDELNSGEYGSHYKNIGSVTGSVQYDLVSGEVIKVNNGETFKFDDTILSNYPLDIDVANSGSLTGSSDLINHTFADILNQETHNDLSYKSYASVDLTKDLLANEELLNYLFIHKKNLVPVVFDNGKQHGSDYEINTAKTDSLFLINFNDLFKNNYSDHYDNDIEKNDDGSLNENAILTLPIVYQAYTSKTVTRTINVTSPDKTVKTIKQTAVINQNVGLDFDHHQYLYIHKGDAYATDNNWSTYDVPTIPGYTANQSQVEAVAVNGDTTDQTVNINYTANKQSVNVNYVDVNDGNKIVYTTTVNGVTDGDTNVPNELPAGYKFVDGQSIPKTIHFNADNNGDINIKVQHATVTVTSDSPKTPSDKLPDNPDKSYPSGVSENDLNKTITRTIKVTTPDGQTKTVAQTIKLTRTATVDEVTGEVTYGKWSTGQWGAYDVPSVAGYTASQTSVAATPVDENTKDQTVDVNYTPNKQSTTIKYVDNKGEIVHTTTVNGATDQTVKVSSEVPAGWTITKGQVPSEITFSADGHEPIEVTVAHQHVTVNPDHPQDNGAKLPDNPAKTFNGVESNDLNKTITRTIKVTTPDGQTKTVAQTAKLTRNADVDEVTGEVTYGKWTTGQWDAYEIPALKGYTPSQTSVVATSVDENMKDQTVDISYTANSQTTHINYVDDAGKTVHTTTITGKTGETVNVPNEVPAGWKITKGEVPSEISFGSNGYADETITIGHQHVTVDPDHPQNNGTKLPDNPAKTFEGVEANDLNKIITRTIKVTTPDGKVTATKQTVKLTRTADVDEVTGEVTYGKWTTGEWTAYNAPSVAGYTPSQTAVAKESVTATSNDTTVEITYQPMQHQISVEYVDDDDHGKIVKTDQMPGKTDQTITVTPSAPANYNLVDNSSRTYTVTSDDVQAVQIHVKHHQVTTSESKTVTRTINVHTPHDGAKTIKQTAELTRKVTTGQVTGEKTYGDWTTGQWKAYTPEAIPGYTPSTNEVPNVNVNGNSKNQMVDVTYTADTQKVEIVYVDDTKGGAVVKTDQVAGKTDETVKVTPDVPAGYELVGKVPGDYTMTAGSHQTITVHLVHQMKTVSESKTVTRTINVHTPHDGVKVVKQTAELTRDVTIDQVTGDKAYGDWSTTEWDRYVVPAVAGYVPSIEQVAQQVVNGTTTDQTIDVIYSSGEHTTHINYVDGDGNIVHTTTIKGQTDGTVQVPNETPTGWMVVGEPVPTELAFGSDGHADVTVTVAHRYVTVTSDQPRENGTKLPDNPAKTFNGVEANDLNKTITRTIKITQPDGTVTNKVQTAKLTRDADVDEVTGKVTYGKWSTGQWDSYGIPALKGYTASQTNVEATPVSENVTDQTVEVSYTPNKQSTTIKYVDDKGQVVYTTTVTGKTDQTVKVPNEVPTGWTITGGQVPSKLTFDADGHEPVVITVSHQHVTVTSDQPRENGTKLPDNPAKTFNGVEANDLNEIITRTIEVTTPDGQTKTVAQTVKLTRNADVDEVTGEVKYGAWTTGQWDAYETPALKGYTASQTNVEATPVDENTKDQTVEINYTPNKQSTTIKYVDGKGEVVHMTTVDGKTDQTVKVPNEVSTGWTITGGQVPSKLTFDADGHEPVVITVSHRHVTVTPDHPQNNGTKLPDNPAKTFEGVEANDLNKTITRTIKVTTPDGKLTTTKQEAKLTRTADVDEVTGEVTYGNWTTGQWDSYEIPVLKGYTASQTNVAAVPVSENVTDQTVDVSYTPNKQSTTIKYVDDKGQVVHTTTVDGVTDQTVKVPNEVPTGWTITGGQVPSKLTFDVDGHEPVVITISHRHVTVTPDQPRENGTKLPDNPAKTFNGVEANDLNEIITRTIKVTTPDGKSTTTKQEAKLTRTADVDEVTGEVTYGNWTTGQWDAYQVPALKGYTASQASVEATPVDENTKDQTVEINYTPNKQSTTIKYVDDKGQVVHTTTVDGVTDQTVKVPSEVPAGWMITEGKVPSEITFDVDGHEPVVITISHRHVTVTSDQPRENGTKLPDNPAKTFNGVDENDLNKMVTRTINVTTPSGKTDTITQTVKLTRTADVDEVTGKVTYGPWSTGKWDAYHVPVLKGYVASQTEVPTAIVGPTTDNQTVTVDYQAVEVPTTPTATPEARLTATLPTSGAKPMTTPTTQPTAPATKAAQLPQTGADKVASGIMSSLGLLMATFSAYALSRKRKNKGHKA